MVLKTLLPALVTLALMPQQLSLEAENLPIRDAVRSLFQQAKITDFSVEENVTGTVTVTVTNQPLESALKQVLRANPIPLTYSRVDGSWIIKVRSV
jgi:type II secretory pathway component GspD/PulD (secretin)